MPGSSSSVVSRGAPCLAQFDVAAVYDRRDRRQHRRPANGFFCGAPQPPTAVADRRYIRLAAFTLIELLTVIGILAVLSGIAFGVVHGVKQRSAIAKARVELAVIAQALEEYRRQYGDYPRTGDLAHATVTPASTVTVGTAEAMLFNSLTGSAGPKLDTIIGKTFVEPGKFTLERENFPTEGSLVANAFLDPWGNRYAYCYRKKTTAGWTTPSYVLYSAGPDGEDEAPNATTGAIVATDPKNADNLYANR